jgi:hypothetical protein
MIPNVGQRLAVTNTFTFPITNSAGTIFQVTNTAVTLTITNGVVASNAVLITRPVQIQSPTFGASVFFRTMNSGASNALVTWQKSYVGTNYGSTNWQNIGSLTVGGGATSNYLAYGETNWNVGDYQFVRGVISNGTLTTISNLQLRLHSRPVTQ